MNDSHSPIRLLRKTNAQGATSAPARPALRRASRLMSLEQRFMFDAAAVATAADAAHAKPDAAALALIAEVAAPTQVKEADPSHSSGRKEVVFVDTNVKGYKTLEAGLPEGFAVVEIDGSRDGLAQMAKWAETHTGYDAIHILSHAAEGKLELGSTLLTDSSLSNAQVQAEWAAVGHALNAGGDLMVYGCDLANGMDGDLFIHDLAKATGADVAASTDLTGAASKDANWILEKQVGDIEATAFSVDGFNDTLGNIVTGNDPGAAYSNTNSDARADVAQSFTATKTGVLTSITVYGSTTSASTLNIYSGDGTSGTLLATQSVNAFNAAGDPDTGSQRYIGSTITLNSTISITNGNQYTFQLTNADGVSITYTTNSDYSGGTAYDAGSQIDPSIDFEFSVVQGDPPNSAPSNSVAPAISGTQTVGNALSATTGTWSDPDSDSLTYSYQWYRADDSSGTNATAIGSATSSSYTLATSDAHKYVRVVVTANDGNSHTPTANSAWTAVNDAAPTNSVVPALSGTATVGNALSTTTGTWSDADSDSLTYSYQWYRADDNSGTNAAAIGSATSSSYTLTSSDGNHYVRVVVTANDSHGSSNQTAASSWTSVATVPSVSSVVRTGGASATVNGSASSVSYTVTFSESVTGVDASDFSLTETGTASGSIASVTGSGATYTVTVDTLSGDGTMRLDLNGSGTGIKNGSSIDIAGGYTSGAAYTLDHTAPNAPSAPDMTAGTDTGSSNSDNITSNTTPTFTGTAESGSTVTLYDTDGTTVLGSGTATGGNWSITASTLSAGSHTVTAKAADAAGNVSSASSGLNLTVDAGAPTVSSVSVPSNGSYKTGQTLSFAVNTNEAVIVDTSGGTPRLALTVGGSTVYANYASGSGSTALTFAYTVQAGDTDADGIAVGALQANGGTLKDTAGNNMTLTLNSVGSTANVLVDTTAPTVDSVAVPSNGTYYTNQNLDFTVNFSEAVTVSTGGGTPRIAVTLDTGGTVYANYLSGSGTTALVFRHTVANGEMDNTGVTVGAMSANGGTLRDAAGNDATLTLNSVGSTAAVDVDGSQPHVTNVSSVTADGGYGVGGTISVTVTFSSPVTVDTTGGAPTLALGDGGVATYASGSGTSTLVFTYTVAAGQNSTDLDYASTSALVLNGGTIKDSGGSHVDAQLTLATPGAAGSLGANKDIVIDTTPPSITFTNPAFSNDNGTSHTDFVTDTASQTITATLSGAPAVGDIVYGSLDNGVHWTNLTSKVSGTTLTWDNVTLTGSGTLKLKVTDSVGNDGQMLSQAYVLQSAAPPAIFNNPALSNDATYMQTDANQLQSNPFGSNAVPDSATSSLPASPTLSFLKPATESLLFNNADNTDARLNSRSIDSAGISGQPSSNELTRGDGGFPIVVRATGNNASGGLVLNRGMSDQAIAGSGTSEIFISADAFAHTDPNATIRLSAQQPDGRPLPSWISFDPVKGKFTVHPPAGMTKDVTVKIVARDSQGHEVATIFKIKLDHHAQEQTAPHAHGRTALSEQIHQAANATSNRLSKLLHAAEWLNS